MKNVRRSGAATRQHERRSGEELVVAVRDPSSGRVVFRQVPDVRKCSGQKKGYVGVKRVVDTWKRVDGVEVRMGMGTRNKKLEGSSTRRALHCTAHQGRRRTRYIRNKGIQSLLPLRSHNIRQ